MMHLFSIAMVKHTTKYHCIHVYVFTFMIHLSGVLWRANDPIPGAIATVEKLQQLQKRVLFVTNNSSKSRKMYADKLNKLGVKAEPDDILCAAYGAATFLAQKTDFDKSSRKAFAIGHEGVGIELRAQGIETIEAMTLLGDKHYSGKEMNTFTVDPTIGAVVIGFDQRLTYSKIAYASWCLHSIPDCIFISTNQDATFPAPGRILPGGGSCVRMLATAAQKEVRLTHVYQIHFFNCLCIYLI